MDKKELISTMIEVLNAPEKKDITFEDMKTWLYERASYEDVKRLLQEDACAMNEAGE